MDYQKELQDIDNRFREAKESAEMLDQQAHLAREEMARCQGENRIVRRLMAEADAEIRRKAEEAKKKAEAEEEAKKKASEGQPT